MWSSELQQTIIQRCKAVQYRLQEPLSRHTSFRIGGPARRMAFPRSGEAAVLLVSHALELAAQNGRTDTDSLRQCYYMVAKKEYRPDPLRLTSGPMLNYNPNLSIYDGLMGGDAHG